MSKSNCPACGCGKAKSMPGGLYKCLRCGGLRDDDPTEGGDYGKRPDERLMRQEREKIERKYVALHKIMRGRQ